MLTKIVSINIINTSIIPLSWAFTNRSTCWTDFNFCMTPCKITLSWAIWFKWNVESHSEKSKAWQVWQTTILFTFLQWLQIPLKISKASAMTIFLSDSLKQLNALSCALCHSFQSVSSALNLAAACVAQVGAVRSLSGICQSSYSCKTANW